jgi:hypothetical protein
MILIDFSSITIATVFAQGKNALNEDLLRHQILNSLRMYNLKYRDKYGKMVICCDGGSWRKDYYSQYKASRKKTRDASSMDWTEIFRILNKVREEITEYMPYQVIQTKGAEADDIIATLVETTQEFGCHEDVMIISSDKDFIQLQQYDNVNQFSPATKKLLSDKNPKRYLFEHIIKGCSGDGVPNIRSCDEALIDENIRQTPIRTTSIDSWFKSYTAGKIESVLTIEEYRNYIRNETCIDLSKIPKEIAEHIMYAYSNAPSIGNGKVFGYLIANKCNNLLECCNDFFIK